MISNFRLSKVIVVACTLFVAAEAVHAQQDMWKHVGWKSNGNFDGQEWSGRGLSYIGKLHDTIPHAIAIAESQTDGRVFSNLAYNNYPGDTARHFSFPGQTIIRGNMNGDAYPDFVCWDALGRNITVLFGTPKIDSFTTAMFMQGAHGNLEFLDKGIVVTDADSDGFDDLILSDQEYDYQSGYHWHGRVAVWRGGPTMDTTPSYSLVGHDYPNQVGGFIGIGNVRDHKQAVLCELRFYGNVRFTEYDTAKLFTYPLGKSFSLIPRDSLILTHDTLHFGIFNGGFALIDIDGDGIDDICTTGTDLKYKPNLLVDPVITVYKGGEVIDPNPTYLLHRPFQNYGGTFGERVINIGDASGKGYPSLLVTDWESYQNSVGTVFLFDIGKGLIDSCVGYAIGQGSDAHFGVSAIAVGDVNHDGRADFMIGSNYGGLGHGELVVFLGDTSYGWRTVGVDEPTSLVAGRSLQQNYPNPFSGTTTIDYSLPSGDAPDAALTLTVSDMYGKRLKTINDRTTAGDRGSITIFGGDLPTGCYAVRLTRGAYSLTRIITIVH